MNKKLTGDPEIDFPEMFDNAVDNADDQSNKAILSKEIQKQNEFLKRALVDEVIDNVAVREDNSIYDKRLKKSLFKRILDALFI